ncbi:MAG: hypothetical protein P3X22_004790 [Thermoprotei archaeon]|nr:hypothetical protein [Thermoprotei archaeon]
MKRGILGFLSRIRHPTREIVVEIITISPISIRFCKLDTCDMLGRFFGVDFSSSIAEEYPEDVKEIHSKVMELIKVLNRRCYVKVNVIEALTPLGFYKVSKYGVEKLPAIIVDGIRMYEGSDWDPREVSEKVCSIALSRR